MKTWQVKRFLKSATDVRPYLHLLRMVHFYNYTHTAQRRLLSLGPDVYIAPTVSFNNAERIRIGSGAHIGAGCMLWAGRREGRIELGDHALLGPGVILTASNYDFDAGAPVMDQATIEKDITVGSDVWLGANVIVVAGVTVGDGCIVGAGSIVTRDLSPGAVAVGSPARIVRYREGFAPVADG